MANNRATKYIYHSEKTKTTCDECKKHDKEVYYDIKDIPTLPIHPNCKCWIEVVEIKSNNNDGVQCDCMDRTEAIKNNIENAIINLSNMLDNIDSKTSDIELNFNNISKLLETLYIIKDEIYSEVGIHNKECKNNVDNLYKEIEDNIKNLNLLNNKNEDISNKLYSLRRETALFINEAKDKLTDINITKEYINKFNHLKSECKSNNKIKEHSINVSNICSKIDDYAIKLKELKEEQKKIENAINASNKVIKFIETRKQTPCNCNNNKTLLKGKLEENIQKVQDLNERKTELEQREKEHILNQTKKSINNIKNFGIQKFIEIGIGSFYDFGGYPYAKNQYGPDTAGMLDLAHEKRNDTEYEKDTIKLRNWNDPKVSSDRKYLVKKIGEQFMAFGFDINNIPGYFFKNNSEPSIRIAKDPDFLNKIKENKNNILNGKDISMEFPRYKDNKKSNLHFAFGHIDIRKGYLDKEGNLHIKVYDTYDFNKENKTTLNQAGREAMLKGELNPFFTIHDILIPKDTINKLWK